MPKEKILVFLILVAVLIAGCGTDDATGEVVAEPDIYEDTDANYEDNAADQTGQQAEETEIETENFGGQQGETEDESPIITLGEYSFNNESIVGTQNNMSISIDSIKHELKSELWGKIVEITTTIYNKYHAPFKPKVLVILYDEKDFKEEWFKPKAEIEFDIDKLNIGEHITRQAVVNIPFDNLTLNKSFKLILVDVADPANKALVVAETVFNAKSNES